MKTSDKFVIDLFGSYKNEYRLKTYFSVCKNAEI